MFGRKAKRIAQLETEVMSLVENDLLREQVLNEERAQLKEARATLGLILDARLPEAVHTKRLVRENINITLKKRAFAAIIPPTTEVVGQEG